MFENKHKQSVKPKSGSIKSKDNFKQLAVPFKDYIDFESVLKGVKNNHRNNNSLSLKNIKIIFFGVMLRKLYVLRIDERAFYQMFAEDFNLKILKKISI